MKFGWFGLLVMMSCMSSGCGTPQAPAHTASSAPPSSAQVVVRLDGSTITHAEIERTIDRLMAAARIPGVAVAIINGGRVAYMGARGWRNVENQQPLTVDTSMPGASFTKSAYAVMVMRLVAEGRLDLDRPVEQYLGMPVAEHEDYRDLAGDDRHHKLTARMLLSHTSGLPNWRRFNDDKKLNSVMMTNSDNGEGIFKELLATLIGDTFSPTEWDGYVPYQLRQPR
jgi:CubicO group peptidase (beta-lactamase class C family)